MAEHLETPELSYHYHLIDMHSLDCESFLQQNNPDALVLAVLCDFKGRPEREVVRHILSRLRGLLQDNLQGLRDYVGMLEILSTNRNLQSVVHEEKTMLSMIDLNELPSYQIGRQSGFQEGRQEGRHEGHQEGRQEGRHDGFAEFLILQLERKFGPLSASQRAKVRRADMTKLALWGERMLSAENLSETFMTAKPRGKPHENT